MKGGNGESAASAVTLRRATGVNPWVYDQKSHERVKPFRPAQNCSRGWTAAIRLPCVQLSEKITFSRLIPLLI